MQAYSCACGATKTEEIPSLGHDFTNSAVYISGKTDGVEHHWKKCSRCAVEDTEHATKCSGGTATTTQKAICSVCGKEYGELLVETYVSLADFCIIYPSESSVITNGSLTSTFLKNMIAESTGVTLTAQQDRYYWPSNGSHLIVIGATRGKTDIGSVDSSVIPDAVATFSKNLKARAVALGKDAFLIETDSNGNIYLAGGSATADRYAACYFLNMYFGYDVYGMNNYSLDSLDDTYKLDLSLLSDGIEEIPAIGTRAYPLYTLGTSGSAWSNEVYALNMATTMGNEQMYVVAGDANTLSHNSMSWLPYATYGTANPNWYNGQTEESKRDLCYTAHGDQTSYNAMLTASVARMKEVLAISGNEGRKLVMFGKQDTTPICTCDACTALANSYGGAYSATVVRFMNDLMARIEADAEITRDDFDLLFFAYEDFEQAPTGLILHERLIPMFAAAYSFNYQASIYDSTNNTGRATLTAWSNISTQIALWTYSSRYNTYMYPVDTFAFYNEEAYKFFADNKVTILTNQSQSRQTGAATAWSNLKVYVESKLAWDTSLKQADLIAEYMTASYGPAAEYMTAFFNSVRTACQNSELMNAYASQMVSGVSRPYTLLGNSVRPNHTGYWAQATILSWLNNCDDAYASIAGLQSTNPELYARYKRNIDIEWVSAAFMHIELYGEIADSTVTKTNLKAVCSSLGMTLCREPYGNTISNLNTYIDGYMNNKGTIA